jgi:uncharacterized protein (TIGR02145 family)
MLKRHNIKLNSSGKVSCLLLFLLTFLLINSITTSVYAFDSAPDDGGTGNTDNTGNSSSSSTITSTVNIALTPESGSASLTPISADGASARYSIKATVGVENSGGYTVYLGSNKSELTGKNTGATINGVTSSATYEELPLNTWGYNAIEGETAGTIFSKVPINNRGDVIASNNFTNIKTDNKTFTLSFAAHIGNDKPADTYENEITLSVISSPLEITGLTSLANMQDMTSDVCMASEVGDSIQLKDTRDGKYYWVTKLADGKCWMTQNLDLDLLTSKTLTTADSDVPAAGYRPAYDTATTASSSTILADNTGQRSWGLGNYRITNPNTSSDCGSKKGSAADCPSQFTAYTTPTTQNGDVNAHYILGNHYQWNTATAGTGGTITSGQASGSICPKGWRLPTSNSGGELETLVNKLGGTSTTNDITQAPFYGVRGGYVNQDTSYLFSSAGDYGLYWSSTPYSSNPNNAYRLDFHGIRYVYPFSSGGRSDGFSVRCIAR